MIFVHLTEAQREELCQLILRAPGKVALRAHMVLLSDRGHRVPEIAAIRGCGCDAVRTWLRRYEQQGASGLEDRTHPGRPRKRTPEAAADWRQPGAAPARKPAQAGLVPLDRDGDPG